MKAVEKGEAKQPQYSFILKQQGATLKKTIFYSIFSAFFIAVGYIVAQA